MNDEKHIQLFIATAAERYRFYAQPITTWKIAMMPNIFLIKYTN